MGLNILQIDPESLAIHVNASLISNQEQSGLLFAIIDFMAINRFDLAERFSLTLTDSNGRLDAVDFCGKFIHELRHHTDLLMLPYSWYRHRQNLEVMSNLALLTLSADFTKLPIPLSSASNPVDARFIGLSDKDFKYLHKFAAPIDSRRRAINTDNRPIEITTGKRIQVGGESMLEALAFWCQRAWLRKLNEGFEEHPKFSSIFDNDSLSRTNLKYNWPSIMFGEFSDMSKHTIDPMLVEPFIMGLLMLCCSGSTLTERPTRFSTSLHVQSQSERDIGHKMPAGRLELITGYILKNRIILNSAEALFEKLEEISEELFSIGFLEEIEKDIALNEHVITQLSEQFSSSPLNYENSIVKFYEDLCSQRREAFKHFKSSPFEYIVPTLFDKTLKKKPRQDIIYFIDRGLKNTDRIELSKMDVSWRPLHYIGGKNLGGDPQENVKLPRAFSFWICPDHLIGENTEKQIQTRSNIYGLLIPISKLLLYGYNYNVMSEVELVHAREMVELHREILFDPDYEYVSKISSFQSISSVLNRNVLICDHCSRAHDNSNSLSALTVRSNHEFWSAVQKNARVRIRSENSKASEEQMSLAFEEYFGMDWSDWGLCNNCLSLYRFI